MWIEVSAPDHPLTSAIVVQAFVISPCSRPVAVEWENLNLSRSLEARMQSTSRQNIAAANYAVEGNLLYVTSAAALGRLTSS